MKRSDNRILTTHVGSLIRPQPLQQFLRAKQAAERYDEESYLMLRLWGKGRRMRP